MLYDTDQTGYKIRLPNYPQRIISLVPSLTELLFDLGLDDEVVGVTDYCIAPEKHVADKPRIGGPKDFSLELIDALRPDLILGDKEENTPEAIHQLRHKHPAWLSDVTTIEKALEMIGAVGRLVNRRVEAQELVRTINRDLSNQPPSATWPEITVAYLIWKEPWMVATQGTFINAMLKACGFRNLFADQHRYPVIGVDKLKDAEVILLSSEPCSFSQTDLNQLQIRFPASLVCRVDGTIFSWYGSRMQQAPAYFAALRRQIQQQRLARPPQ
ncbi:MAG: ABC transporter substrate-binding protein [Desulfuromonas sp.]|nr:ABC transporter substrate-binding protein [Desulfuromonas sp.]